MYLQKAERRRVKMKCLLAGPAGAGKTFSALLLARGLATEWEKIVVVDSENESSHLYAHLGPYNVVSIKAPFTPEKYSKAIAQCVEENMEVIIIDSTTHMWTCLLEIHSMMQGNSFTNWGKITPRNDSFMQKMLQCPCHIVATTRTKQDYILAEKNGKTVPEKVGLKAIQRDGLEYEFTVVFDIDINHVAKSSKDRTGLFINSEPSVLSAATGIALKNWCNSGIEFTPQEVLKRVEDCKTVKDLINLYEFTPQFNEALKPEFEKRKHEIILARNTETNLSPVNILSNGTN